MKLLYSLNQKPPHDIANFLHSGITTSTITIVTVLLHQLLPKSSRKEEREALTESRNQVQEKIAKKAQAEEEAREAQVELKAQQDYCCSIGK